MVSGKVAKCMFTGLPHREREKGGCEFHTASWSGNEAITGVCGCHGNSVLPGCPL